jgi:hypothetical protein
MKEWLALVASHEDTELHRTALRPAELPQIQVGRVLLYAMKSSDLKEWMQTLPKGAVADRGVKHPQRSLSDYLHSNGRHVVLRSTYKNVVQIKRGIDALLAASHLRRRTGLLILGFADPQFAQIYATAPDLSRTEIAAGSRPVAGVTDPLLEVLHDEFKRAPIPADLVRKYQGKSQKIDWVRRLILLAAKCPYPVLIEGETGTGKEIVARQIHENSERRFGRFMPINCGGIPEYLLESELFGHKKGAFTGALQDKEGMWVLADKGTLFLDEVGDMSLSHQVKVLRALDSGCLMPVGGDSELFSTARVIAATNRDLRKMVEQGRFREDLYYRLYAVHIRTPALRDHPEDIPDLVAYLWSRSDHAVSLPPLPATAALGGRGAVPLAMVGERARTARFSHEPRGPLQRREHHTATGSRPAGGAAGRGEITRRDNTQIADAGSKPSLASPAGSAAQKASPASERRKPR